VAEGLGAGGAGADGAELVVAVYAGGVAVGEGELDGVVADGVGGFGGGLGLEHGQGGGGGWARGCEVRFFLALVVAGGAGAFFAEVVEIVMAGVAVGPGYVYAGTGGNVDFYGGGFFAGVYGRGHGIGDSRQFTVERWEKEKAEQKTTRFNAEAAEVGHRDHGETESGNIRFEKWSVQSEDEKERPTLKNQGWGTRRSRLGLPELKARRCSWPRLESLFRLVIAP
jgi:hypothetical protein